MAIRVRIFWPDPTRPEKYMTRTRFFFTRSKNGLTRDPTRFYYGSTRPDPDNPWPDPLKKSLIFFLITSWYFVHKTQNIKTNNKIQMYQHQCLSLIRQKTSQWTMKHWNITQLHTQVSDNNRQGQQMAIKNTKYLTQLQFSI